MERITKTWLTFASASVLLLASCSKLDFIKNESDKLPNDVIIQWNLISFMNTLYVFFTKDVVVVVVSHITMCGCSEACCLE